MMQAAIWTRYGPPEALQLEEIAKPLPKDDEVLIRVRAATVTLGDCEMRRMKLPLLFGLPLRLYVGLLKPKRIRILGQELAGDIEAVGEAVTRFKPGGAVFAPTMLRLGAYAEYTCLPEKHPVLKPDGLSYAEAATIPTGGINGLYFVRAASLRPGEHVLINGAGGGIGSYAVQIAKSLGAEVSAVDSAEKLDMLRSIGADHVIDYAREDYTKIGRTYDAIIDVAGKSPFARSVQALKPGGRFILGNPSFTAMIRARLTRMREGKKAIIALADYKPEYYAALIELIAAGKLKPVIDRSYPLGEIAAAHRYVDEGHKKGNLVITV